MTAPITDDYTDRPLQVVMPFHGDALSFGGQDARRVPGTLWERAADQSGPQP